MERIEDELSNRSEEGRRMKRVHRVAWCSRARHGLTSNGIITLSTFGILLMYLHVCMYITYMLLLVIIEHGGWAGGVSNLQIN